MAIGASPTSGVLVMLTIDVSQCEQRAETDCFSDVVNVAAFLGAAQAKSVSTWALVFMQK